MLETCDRTVQIVGFLIGFGWGAVLMGFVVAWFESRLEYQKQRNKVLLNQLDGMRQDLLAGRLVRVKGDGRKDKF